MTQTRNRPSRLSENDSAATPVGLIRDITTVLTELTAGAGGIAFVSPPTDHPASFTIVAIVACAVGWLLGTVLASRCLAVRSWRLKGRRLLLAALACVIATGVLGVCYQRIWTSWIRYYDGKPLVVGVREDLTDVALKFIAYERERTGVDYVSDQQLLDHAAGNRHYIWREGGIERRETILVVTFLTFLFSGITALVFVAGVLSRMRKARTSRKSVRTVGCDL